MFCPLPSQILRQFLSHFWPIHPPLWYRRLLPYPVMHAIIPAALMSYVLTVNFISYLLSQPHASDFLIQTLSINQNPH